jgi:hypothetical protein
VPEVGQEAADIMAAVRDGVPWSGGFPVRRKDRTRFPALVTDAGVYRDGALVGIIGVSTNLGCRCGRCWNGRPTPRWCCARTAW